MINVSPTGCANDNREERWMETNNVWSDEMCWRTNPTFLSMFGMLDNYNKADGVFWGGVGDLQLRQ